MAQVLLDLAALITEAAEKIDLACKSQNVFFPSLNQPFDPESERIRANPQVVAAIETLVAAADHIIAAAWSPARYMLDTSLSYHIPSALRVASVTNAAECIRETGPQGAHVKDIVAGTVVDPAKLARVLRLLVSRHIFREVSPDVFANNRLSSLLDTGKSIAELRADPSRKFDNIASGSLTAIVEDATDEAFRASACLAAVLTCPTTAGSDCASATAMARSLNVKNGGNYWTWLAEPANADCLRRNCAAIQAFAHMSAGEEHIIHRFDWYGLPNGATVIDVGGGMGDVAAALSASFPHLRLVVQDKPQTVLQGEECVSSGIIRNCVEFQAHDFFACQPASERPPSVYLLRFILHDWSDSSAVRILRKLREAASQTTRLVIIERIIPYACETATSCAALPASSLPNLGAIKLNGYLLDVHMLMAFNGQERTLLQFGHLLAAAEWKLEEVHNTGSVASLLVCSPSCL
ncbi:S-adenosyl-L-methionine-dependent methyltransferase [Auricularia subglabra TFB-10046 SS5]|nr:S-adenosyl-L-methionine-dependent methyltransferase [Auricularia subglabra TFB-10046 SS5]